MKLPTDIEDKYLKEVLSNTSLENLSNEEWKFIESFENYAISNYGRIKSLARCVVNSNGGKWILKDYIKKPCVFKYFNKYLETDFYTIRCSLSLEGREYGKSIPRLVYHHFVEKFDMDDRSLLISFKDSNQFHVHADNLEKLSVSDVHFKTMKLGRGKKGNFDRAVSQYTIEGLFVASYENIDAAADNLDTNRAYILAAIEKKRLIVGEFRWFLKEYIPTKKDFVPIIENKGDKILNVSLWEKLGCPAIDENNPPACMNLSLKDLQGEIWKPLPSAEDQFHISNKGRIKRLNSRTHDKTRRFLSEHIMALFLNFYSDDVYYFYININYKGKRIQIRLNRYLYYCFVKEFDMNDRTLAVVNQSEPLWNLDLAKISLRHVSSFLNK